MVNPVNRDQNDNTGQAMELIRIYLEENFSKQLTIRKLAQFGSMNEALLKSVFKEINGITIHRFLVKKRMEHAAHLLSTTNEAMKYIAYQVGYKPRNFFIAFKKYYTESPASYRKRNR